SGDRSASVPLLPHSALPVIEASVNGLPPGPFIVDTGASTSVLARDYCDRHQISYEHRNPFPVNDGGGREIQAFPALVEQLDVGAVQIRNWTAYVMEFSPRLKIAGILSPLDTLRGMASEFDMRQREFRLYPGASAAEWRNGLGEPVRSARLV